MGAAHRLPPGGPGGPWGDCENPPRGGGGGGRAGRAASRRYFRILTQAAQSRLFDFIGHADVIKVCGYRPAEDISDLYEAAASAFAAAGVCVEINTAGWRKPVGEVYPAPRFLEACHRAGVPVLINADAHIPDDVGRDFDRAASYAREVGYTEVAMFASRTRRMVPLA